MKTFEELHAELTMKWATKDPESGTVTRLLEDGVHGIGKKVVEEAAEAWMAAEFEGKERAAAEISQLIFFTQVLMIAADVAGYPAAHSARELVVLDPDNDVEFFFLRPRDIATYVATGQLDVGITGLDMLIDSGVDAEVILELGFARSSFRFAVPKESAADDLEALRGKRIATSYDGLLRSRLAEMRTQLLPN